ncbi:MAG: hypothetical protein LUE96_11510 [Lachnospiraceae bacterium]|nr:hypothetical protein [Lachnospiraceae bacterium]
MIFVLLNWAYIFVTAFLLGFAFSRLTQRLFGYRPENIIEIIFFGLIAATVYAQLFSLFWGVGAAADFVLAAVCAVIFIFWRKNIMRLLTRSLKSSGAGYKAALAGLVLVWCYCTSRGYMHYDSDLYHAQSIRWIEEYGVVPGLGNIHVRFAYNSSFFALSALYGMRDVFGQSLHTVNGLIALLLSVELISMFTKRARGALGGFALSDFARLGAFYYLTLIYSDIVSPASDYCVMCVVFYIVIRGLSYLEREEKAAAPYALLCVAGVYGVTLKLTAGVLLLLVLKPAYMLLKEKRFREICLYVLMGALVLAPWMIRTALISGYLLYPFPALDVLDVDWKIDAAAAALDAAEIKTWGRGLNDASLVGLPIWEWFPQWFKTTLPAIGKLFVSADIVCAAIAAGLCVCFLLRPRNKKPVEGTADKLLVLAAVTASYVFWQLSAPLLRYGYAYVLLLITLTGGILYQRIGGNTRLVWCAAVVLAAAKAVSLADYAADMADKPYYVRQQDYGSYALESFEAGGITFYYPVSGDRVGYESFPAIPRRVELQLRGDTIKDGFRAK